MGPSTNKKVVIHRFDRETLSGFVNPGSYLQSGGVELLSASGTFALVPYPEMKIVCFVRDFSQLGPRKELRLFTSRPKMDGLWIRMKFRDGELMDGVLSNNLLLLDPWGFNVVPPDPGYQNQRVFVPRAALAEMHVLGVVGSQLTAKRKPSPKDQLEMFTPAQPG